MPKLQEDGFFFDANCDSPALIRRLRDEHGLICASRLEQFGEPQPGRAGISDERLFEFCQQQQFVMVTKNRRHFERLVAAAGDLHYGVIFISNGQMTREQMYEALIELLIHHPASFFGTTVEI
jgi:hypothetical protein